MVAAVMGKRESEVGGESRGRRVEYDETRNTEERDGNILLAVRRWEDIFILGPPQGLKYIQINKFRIQ